MLFLWGVLRRFYLWAPAILLHPFDLYNRYIRLLLPEGRRAEWSLPATLFPYVLAVGLLWAAVLTYHEQRGRSTEKHVLNTLGRLLDAADAIGNRKVTTQEEYEQWVKDLNEWFKGTQSAIRRGLSEAEVSVFRDTSGMVRVFFGGTFNGDHNSYLNSLDKYKTNLRSIIERHSS